ncbi:hypothetical protein WR25_23266 [Diploscapter pachys]|uniref:Sodium/solute symporter n=1 Tax=Diploscapter pachys TaxID=2018661 RepID=A0A2A2J716_9BILA|nr:hypothetical protein WR25_23266 [Diploscapter pachys]
MEIADLVVLVGFLLGISVYGFVKSRQTTNNAREILVGSEISAFSVALSVCSGYLSSISLLGFPAEVYFYGGMILWFFLVYLIAFPLVAFVFLPVLHRLNTTSIYETLLYNSVALYAPSLALSSLAGIPLVLSITLSAVLSAVYISFGGAKAGIHTSAIQMLVIFASMAVLVAIGLRNTTLQEVLSTAHNGHRLNLYDLRMDPRVRHSIWSVVIGGTGNVLCLFASNQLSMQKYMVMKNLKDAQRVVLLNIPFNAFILLTYVSTGLIVYQYYANCHPQLGTLSSSFAALSALLISDATTSFNKGKIMRFDEKRAVIVARFLPIIFAFLTVGMAILCSKLKTIVLQISFIVFGAAGGPVLGSFVVGLFFKCVRGQAALAGIVSSILISFVVAIGSAVLKADPVQLPLVRDCRAENITIASQMQLPENYGYVKINQFYGLENIFQVSYQYYSIIGVLSNVIVSIIWQHCFGGSSSNCEDVPDELLSPMVRSKSQPVESNEVEQNLMEKHATDAV